MLDLTYEALARKKDALNKEFQELLDRVSLKDFEESWMDMDFNSKDGVLGAEDGSINHRRFKNLVVYTVNAVSLIYDDGDGIKKTGYADIGLLHPYYQIEERLHLYRAIYEVKAAIKDLNKVDLYLIDGSLLSDLKSLRRLETGLSKTAKEEVIVLLPEIESSTEVGITAHRLRSELTREDYAEKVGFLEYVEYLTCLERLLSKGLEKIVGISKLSTRSRPGLGVPDLALFEEATMKAGHSRLEQDFVQKRFPVYDEFFRSLVFTITNIRLEDNKSVYMLEVPREVDEQQAQEIMEMIRSISVDGYPYLLKKAHQEVVITNQDIDRIAAGLGITAKTGREVLR